MTDVTASPLAVALRESYVLEREVGRGGMATVYLARDLKHDRPVALKVLNPALAAAIGADRFLVEIRTTANLQHPHILPLFDSGEVASSLFYVMPYVEGESLRDRLLREKQLPIGDAVRIASEVASALDYAHRHGIIHRDIKPGNVLLHDGQALVADFGIALAASRAGGTRLTETGLSLGTPHYMSPEQVMGDGEITARSDVYALGAVVYEMLIGGPPFTGPTAQGILARVLTEEPTGLRLQRRTVPEHVEAAVLTALEKLPADRFATAAEFARALGGEGSVTLRGSAPVKRTLAAVAAPWRTAALAASALALTLAAAGAWAWRARPRPAPPPLRRTALMLSGERDPRAIEFAVSGDGSTVAVNEAGGIGIRRMDRMDLLPARGSDGADQPFLSADGARVGFRRGQDLVVERVDGSDVVTMPFPTGRYPADGGDDRVVAVDSAGLVLLDLRSFRRQLLLRAPPRVIFLQPVLPPGGKHVLLTALTGQFESARILSLDLASRRLDTLLDAAALGPQVADGQLYFARPDGALYAVGYDATAGRVLGAPVPIGDVAIIYREGRAAFGAGRGLVVYAERPKNRVIALSPDGRREVLTPEPGTLHNPRVSPDGRRIVLDRDVGGRKGRDVWVLDLATHLMTRVTSRGDAHDPVWTPDGRHITYISFGTPGGPFFTISADGRGRERAMRLAAREVHPGQWLPDGRRYVAGVSDTAGHPSDLLALSDAGAPPESLVTSPYDEHSPAVSPDGRTLVYTSDETGVRQVYARALDGEGGQTLVSEASGEEPVWSRDGRQLYYVEHRGAASRLLAARIAAGVPPQVIARSVVIDQFNYEPVNNHANWDVAPDGRLVFVEPQEGNRLVMVFNWHPEEARTP